MEAIWTRFIPAMRVATDCVQSSGIGDVVGLDVDYGFDGHGAPPRLTDPLLGGGALYDVGTYGLHLATLFADHNPHPPIPEILHTKAKVRPDGVDETYNGILCYPSKVIQWILVCFLVLLYDVCFLDKRRGIDFESKSLYN